VSTPRAPRQEQPGSGGAGGLARENRGPRRSSLQARRVHPFSVLKSTLIVSLASYVVWLAVVSIVYAVLSGVGALRTVNSLYVSIANPGPGFTGLITPSRVFGVTALLGVAAMVVATIVATIAAFVYNIAAGLAGGLEITLSERD
jgi:hypothetical protein